MSRLLFLRCSSRAFSFPDSRDHLEVLVDFLVLWDALPTFLETVNPFFYKKNTYLSRKTRHSRENRDFTATKVVKRSGKQWKSRKTRSRCSRNSSVAALPFKEELPLISRTMSLDLGHSAIIIAPRPLIDSPPWLWILDQSPESFLVDFKALPRPFQGPY